MINLNQIKIKYKYFLIFGVAFLLRLIYSFYLQKFMWGEYKFVHPDTFTFSNSFLNLINHGRYCFDLSIQDSCFYRLPTYPFFLGIQNYLFGDFSWISVSISQSAIDAGSCCLAFAICRRLSPFSISQWVCALIFIFYPFTIVWVPQQVPEVLGVFLVLLSIYLIISVERRYLMIFGVGVVLVLAVWTKQYIAALLPSIFLFLAARVKLKNYSVFLCGIILSFLFFYSPWVIRNYINYGQLAPLMGATTGARHYLSDYAAAMKFVGIFYENQNDVLDLITKRGELHLPKSYFVDTNRDQINLMADLAFKCGPSFRMWRGEKFEIDDNTVRCEKMVADGFNQLTRLAKIEMNFFEFYKTGFEGFTKGFIKINHTDKSGSSFVQTIFFGYRSVLIFLAFLAIAVVRQRNLIFFILGTYSFWLGTLVVLSFGYRHVEMRYLLMADSLMLVCSGLTISWIIDRTYSFKRLKLA